MFIKLDDRWALASDEHCWKIQQFQEPNERYPDGRWKSKYFLTTFRNAVERLARIKIRLSEATTMEEAIRDAKSVRSELDALFDYEVNDVER
jgi:hypothetical protein